MEQKESSSTHVTNPSYGDLPMEIILQILDYLNPADKKAVSTACRRWYEAFIDPKFQAEFLLKLSNIYLADNVQPLATFLHCSDCRPFVNVHLQKVELGSTSEFFERFGDTIAELTIDTMDINEHQLASILKRLHRLKSLTIRQSPEIFMSGQFLKSEADRRLLSHVFEDLESLAIVDNRYLTDAILFRVVELISNLRRLNLSGSPIAFHNAVCKRFYPRQDIEPSESILTFKYVREVVEKYQDTLKELDLSHTLVGSDALESLGKIGASWRLEKLILRSCLQLTMNSLISYLNTQPDIVHIDCSAVNFVAENWAARIVDVLPQLQVLKLANCKTLTDNDVIKIGNLRNLKHLDISYCSSLTTAGIVQGIAKDRNEIILELKLSGLNINEACIMQCVENFPNLRIFDISYCVTAATDVVVQSIVQNLIWLRELNLENCSLITDTGITGFECSTAKLEQPQAEIYSNVSLISQITNSMKISLRSRAEDEIIADADRKRTLLALIEDTNNSTAFSGSGLSLKRLKGLRSLNLGGCTKITDISLKYGLAFRELATLSLANCQQISFTGIQVLLQNCPSIENLYLANCCNINDLTIELIAMRLKRLHLIDIRGCRQLTEKFINDIHFHCRTEKV